jgi:hypothetical protein
MDETNPTPAVTQVAIECLTLWLQDRQRAIDYIANLELNSSRPGPTDLTIGLLHLSAWLLFSLAETQGEATAEELQVKAANILRQFSEYLPD